ncbi:MAG: ATP-binding protein [Solirubrobacteraceae bacterium]
MRSSRSRSSEDPPRCPLGICDGSGFEIDEQTNSARDCACRAQLVANARARHLRDRVPRRYLNLSWDRHPLTTLAKDPLNADSVRKVKRYCADIQRNLAEGKGLWLMGHTGTGKTTLGYTIAASAARERHSVLSFNAVALLNRVRDTIDADSRERRGDVIRTLTEVELLHIEDLRVVRPTEWVLEQLYLIVNARYEEQRAIVFTSDVESDADGPLAYDARELADHVGMRTFSRLIEICGDPTVIAGRDNRLDYDVPGVVAPEEPWTAPEPPLGRDQAAALTLL